MKDILIPFVVGGCIGALSVSWVLTLNDGDSSTRPDVPAANVAPLSRSTPTLLSIPAIGVTAPFGEPLGLGDDGSVMVPKQFDHVGWYQYGPTPGEEGASVILGHVDSPREPAVFYDLKKLRPHDLIAVGREDGVTAFFTVTEVVTVDQDDFPTERVYGKTDFPSLRLVTCAGVFDRGVRRYSHNLIVFATLIDTKPADGV